MISNRVHRFVLTLTLAGFSWVLLAGAVGATSVSLERLVEPSSVLEKDGAPVRFALNFFLEFETLEEMFGYVDAQAGRWTFESEAERKAFADGLARRGIESRVVSMVWQDPFETLITHTREQLGSAIEGVSTKDAPLVYRGESWSLDIETYRSMFQEVQQRWKSSLNCWSAAPSVEERVLSNWYLIPEGITLFGATYDSTEHFWQAVKFHPEVSLEDLSVVLEAVEAVSWQPWLEGLAADQAIYLDQAYTVEFLKRNLSERLGYFRETLDGHRESWSGSARTLQQRTSEVPWRLRITALEEKIFWGDLADVFHLLHYFGHLDQGRLKTPELEPVLVLLETHRFDGIYLEGYREGKVGFISPEFRELMLEIWRVKFLEMERFGEVLRSTRGKRLLHFLNDGTSPDIPIPVYEGYLEEIRELALAAAD